MRIPENEAALLLVIIGIPVISGAENYNLMYGDIVGQRYYPTTEKAFLYINTGWEAFRKDTNEQQISSKTLYSFNTIESAQIKFGDILNI